MSASTDGVERAHRRAHTHVIPWRIPDNAQMITCGRTRAGSSRCVKLATKCDGPGYLCVWRQGSREIGQDPKHSTFMPGDAKGQVHAGNMWIW